MSIRMQRDINELTERVEKLEAVTVRLIARLDAIELDAMQEPVKKKPGRPRKNGTDAEVHA